MYFPYLRGRQYELLALREMVENGLLGKNVIPVIEPVKLSPSLVLTMESFIQAGHNLSVIRNPSVGSFVEEWKRAGVETKGSGYKQRFMQLFKDPLIIKSLIVDENIQLFLKEWEEEKVVAENLLTIIHTRDALTPYQKYFSNVQPAYTFIPDESALRRRLKSVPNRVWMEDRFIRQERNADYLVLEDEFFSDDHLYYKDEGYVGFSDFSVIGDEYIESGFAPYAVAIHIVYFDEDETLRVRHFVSDSNTDIRNPAGKFYEAVTKLHCWVKDNPSKAEITVGLNEFLKHYENESYPGLGTVKKLSLMHHLELMSRHNC